MLKRESMIAVIGVLATVPQLRLLPGEQASSTGRVRDGPVMIPAFQGQPPSQAFVHTRPACTWHSDSWFYKAGLDVLAEGVHYTVTSSGNVHVTSEYPALPLPCE